jgi:Protein of unknown function (Hypoth_ymh)
MVKKSKPAGIEYAGIAGASRECQNAVMRLLQFGDEITHARILSNSKFHCLLLTINTGDLVAIKSGFSSGYGGEGPRRFSYTIQLLDTYGAELEEYAVDEAFIERLDQSALTVSDLEILKLAKPTRPSRLYEYIQERHFEDALNGRSLDEFPPVVPLSIIDPRIVDLAISFWKSPDDRLLKGYRRLEDIIRQRAGITDHGQKVFSQAFSAQTPRLFWRDIDDGEKQGRINLFTGAYMAHRNPRSHRELEISAQKQLSEFLLLNHLYLLERGAEVSTLP